MKHRIERVQEVVRRELSDLIHRHMNFNGALVTVNQVDMTPDLKQAHIFVGVIGPESEKKNVLHKLEAQRKLLQHEMGKRVVIKYTPHLHFKLDETVERATRILHIMDELEPLADKPAEPPED